MHQSLHLQKKRKICFNSILVIFGYNANMKLKHLISLALLFVLSFSIMHEFAFTYLDNDHCTTAEYVSELELPSEHGDVCDVHYKFHQSIFFPSQPMILPKVELEYSELALIDVSYYFNNPLELFKPPIS